MYLSVCHAGLQSLSKTCKRLKPYGLLEFVGINLCSGHGLKQANTSVTSVSLGASGRKELQL